MHHTFQRILVTAALPYANGKIHLGHLAGAYLPADIYVRFQRSMKRDVVFVCGSDEHGVPITITADQEKISPQAVVDRYHELNKISFQKFGMSFDVYSRTSAPSHHETAREFFLNLHKAGILKEKKEKQLYDEKAGMFLPDRYVEGTCPVCANTEARGDQCEKCGTFLNPLELKNPKSKISGGTPTVRETVHWYFPLGKYQDELREYIDAANKRDGWKENVLQYCESWFKAGLKDRAVTRDLQWGVKVPLDGFDSKVLYVWFDAVLGYISGTKEWAAAAGKADSWRRYWLDPTTKYVAFIGKDNVVFHCIVFPAMLMAWNANNAEKYILPENVPANEFLNFQGQKFSKSRGWGIDVDDFLSVFPPDTLRYALVMNMPESRDADFYWKDFQARTNNELADILGNFVNRTMTFAHRNFGGRIPELSPTRTESDRSLVQLLESTATGAGSAGELIETYHFREAALKIMNLARAGNKYFDASEPWKSIKTDAGRCATTINLCLEIVRTLAILFEPILPHASATIWQMLNLEGLPGDSGWKLAGSTGLKAGHQLNQPEILFTKIEDDVIERQIASLPTNQQPKPSTTPALALITIDDFKKINLRTAKIIEAERVPKSEKLLKLQLIVGEDRRQVIAGIGQHYKPEDLIGRTVVVVANLAPAKLMGHESQGMVLAASNDDGKLSLITVGEEIAGGSIVR